MEVYGKAFTGLGPDCAASLILTFKNNLFFARFKVHLSKKDNKRTIDHLFMWRSLF